MKIPSALKSFVTGLSVPQEYCCIDLFDFPDSLVVKVHNYKALDVTSSHLFLGYKPLIFGIVMVEGSADYHAIRSLRELVLGFSLPGGHAVAALKLAPVGEQKTDNGMRTLLFEGKRGTHYFLNSFHQLMNRFKDARRKPAAGNVSLPGNLNDQVRIAYAVPRIISVITLSDGSRMNMFPTDLHGPVGDGYYAGSLRTGGRANEQVESQNTIVLSEVKVSWFGQAYQLGKNHMQPLKNEKSFGLHDVRSATLGIPLPDGAVRYRELVRVSSCAKGIHTLHFYKILSQADVQTPSTTLAHVHQYLVQWRMNRGISTRWFRR